MAESHRTADRQPGGPAGLDTTALSALAEHPRHRAIVDALCAEGELGLHRLATQVLARRKEISVADVDAEARERLTVDLHHRHVPRLAEAGLVDREGYMASLAIPSEEAGDALATLDASPAADAFWEGTDVLFEHTIRERIVSVLATADDSLALGELARTLAATEDGRSTDSLSSIRTSLHHLHLPKLAAVGVLTYDTEDHSVGLDQLPRAYRSALSGDAQVASYG